MTNLSIPLPTLASKAAAAACSAAGRSGVRVSELHDLDDLNRLCELFQEIWRADPEVGPPVTAEWLKALTHSGNYVTGAFSGEDMVGACIGFFAEPAGRGLHSHIAGVAAGSRARNVGYAIKLHQRAWALARGLTRVTWTYDPLVSRNAYFNIAKLGALPREYVPDFYGPMADAINAGDPSDRMVIEWRLDAERVMLACSGVHLPEQPGDPVKILSVGPGGRPTRSPASGPVALIEVPADIEGLRISDRALATVWRETLREVLGGLLTSGARVTGFTRSGCYVIDLEAS
ncbi:GNAT family N-acetyltransferase [Microtetraspora malaysiensis]|uniref:GNAT family N-acetyltransferase n=1 Tax=Microtetraspora malaysiensis TaxID=161358 RepID=A0ABW6T508_9ACTN